MYKIKSYKHVGVLTYYMKDAPGLKTKISSIQEPGHKNLVSLAKNYHYHVCAEDEQCIQFKKELPLVKLNMEAVGGWTKLLANQYINGQLFPNRVLWPFLVAPV